MATLVINGIDLDIKRTWIYEGSRENSDDSHFLELTGKRCVELRSSDDRYKVITTMDAIADKIQ